MILWNYISKNNYWMDCYWRDVFRDAPKSAHVVRYLILFSFPGTAIGRNDALKLHSPVSTTEKNVWYIKSRICSEMPIVTCTKIQLREPQQKGLECHCSISFGPTWKKLRVGTCVHTKHAIIIPMLDCKHLLFSRSKAVTANNTHFMHKVIIPKSHIYFNK